MIHYIISYIKNASQSQKVGRFISDKSYKYDTIFFMTKYIFENYVDNKFDYDLKKDEIIDYTTNIFNLNPNNDGILNFMSETINVLQFSFVLKKNYDGSYTILDQKILEFISISIENSYIFLYLICYISYRNDGMLVEYHKFVNNPDNNVLREQCLINILNKTSEISPSIVRQGTQWEKQLVKFPLMVLGLANDEYEVTRGLAIKKNIVNPYSLSANVEGTKTKEEFKKSNEYIKYFKINYVKEMLRNTIIKDRVLFNIKGGVSNLIKREPRNRKLHSLNSIIYGAPGTGKTYATPEYAMAIIENRELSQDLTLEYRKTLMENYQSMVDLGRIVFTTFHQSYSYEDFIQGLRPDTNGDSLKFIPIDGVFKKISENALNDPNENYVIIVDEINRANISKVLGELITLIEEDKRWGEINELSVKLPSGDVFVVPNNLYIVGTMNTADKSIALIDMALRRRFAFVEKKVEYLAIKDSELMNILKIINDKLIDEFQSTDLLIGQAYFINKTLEELPKLMNQKIIPLLYEYYSDDSKKVNSLLKEALRGTNYKIFNSKQERIKIIKNNDNDA